MPKLNVELLKKVRQHLVDNPESYDHLWYIEPTEGQEAKGCICYHVCAINGDLERVRTDRIDGYASDSLERVAAIALGLEPGEDLMYKLVYDRSTLGEFSETPCDRVGAKGAIRAIDLVLKQTELAAVTVQ